MIILEKPFTSNELARYLESSQIPVLDNAAARKANARNAFNLTPEDEFARRVNNGERLYTTSENALEWVASHIDRPELLRAVESMKDKGKLRQALAPLYPDYFFRVAGADELPGIAPDSLPLPVVLKPVVGFFSVGVYVIETAAAWRSALADIAAKSAQWRRDYPDSVVGGGRFIIEQYATGDEYAVDAYYDADGQPVVVDILKHDFSSGTDVSDRLYYTSPEIIRDKLDAFTDYLRRVGAILDIRDFPLHLEVRVGPAGIVPIEFNPLRFAGWCCTDISLFAYGFQTYDYYLRNARPDWDALLAGKENATYSMTILDRTPKLADVKKLDLEKVAAQYTKVLHMRPVECADSPVFAFVFARTPSGDTRELESIVASDLTEFIA